MTNIHNVSEHSAASPEILPPTNDWVFKLLFGDERNKHNLIALLKSFVELPQEDFELVYLDPHLKPEATNEKLGILDVKVKTKSGKILNIELQVDPMPDIGKRISFYKSKLVVSQSRKGKDYSVIQKVICICITKYTLFPDVKEYLNSFLFMNPKNGHIFEDIPEIVYTLETSKLPVQHDGSGVWEWLQFLRATQKEEFEMIAKQNPEIRNAVDTLYELSANPEVRAQYDMREKTRMDRTAQFNYAYNNGVNRGRAEGLAKGIERGRAEEREQFVRNLLAMGMPMEEIARATKLPVEKVRTIVEGQNS